MTDSALLAHIAKQPNGMKGLKYLFKELRVKGEDCQAIETALNRLTARGDLVALSNGVRQELFISTEMTEEQLAGAIEEAIEK